MAQLLPAHWRQTLVELREDIQRALERWLPKWRIPKSGVEHLPVRWREAVEHLQGELHDAIERWVPRWRDAAETEERWLPSVFTGAGPLIEIEEAEDRVVIWAELPGLDKNDFTVEVAHKRVVLKGEKKRATEDRQEGYYYAERSYGAFARVIPLPCEVEREKAQAKYKNGVLRIALPKTTRAKAARVRVRVAE